MNYRIEVCIDWVCWTTQSSCFNVRYPCGVKYCRRWRIKYPCGVEWCQRTECVSYPVPYSCEQCTGCSIMDLINGVLNALKALLDALNGIMATLASELDINFPSISIPGLPSIDFIVKIQNIFANMFDDIFVDINFLNIDTYFNNLFAKLDFAIPSINPFCTSNDYSPNDYVVKIDQPNGADIYGAIINLAEVMLYYQSNQVLNIN